MNETDFALATVYTIAFLIGYLKGIFKTILGPISLFLGTIISYIVYANNKNIVLALVIGLFGPFVIRLILTLLCKAFIETFSSDENKEMSSLSRVFGGIFSILWSGTLFTIFILLVTLIPLKFDAIVNIQDNIKSSKIVKFLGEFIRINDQDPVTAISNISDILKDPEKAEKARQTSSYKELVRDSSIRDLLRDKEVMKQIEEKDFAKLLQNKKVIALMEDPEAIKKIFAFQQELIEGSSSSTEQTAKEKSEPKFILFKD